MFQGPTVLCMAQSKSRKIRKAKFYRRTVMLKELGRQIWQENPIHGALVEFSRNGASWVDARIQKMQGAEEQKRDVMIWYQGLLEWHWQVAKEEDLTRPSNGRRVL